MSAFEKIMENGIASKRTKRIATVTGIVTVAAIISLMDDKGVFETTPKISKKDNFDAVANNIADNAEAITEAFKESVESAGDTIFATADVNM